MNAGDQVNGEPLDLGPEPLPERRISDVETIKALSDPLRLRILEVMTAGHARCSRSSGWRRPRREPDEALSPRQPAGRARASSVAAGQRVVSGIIETSYRIGQLERAASTGPSWRRDSAGMHEILTTVFDGARDDIERGTGEPAPSASAKTPSRPASSCSPRVWRGSRPSRRWPLRTRVIELIDAFDIDRDIRRRPPYGLVLGFYPMADLPSADGRRMSEPATARDDERPRRPADSPTSGACGLAQGISDVGDGLTMLTLMLLVNQLTRSTLALAAVAIALAIPPLTDRPRRRHIRRPLGPAPDHARRRLPARGGGPRLRVSTRQPSCCPLSSCWPSSRPPSGRFFSARPRRARAARRPGRGPARGQRHHPGHARHRRRRSGRAWPDSSSASRG